VQIVKCENQGQWDGWIVKNSAHHQFPQSWQWGEILISEGKKVERLFVMENNQPMALAQVFYAMFPLGIKYAFCQEGPIFNPGLKEEELKVILHNLAEYFKIQNCIFFRLEPSLSLPIVKYKMRSTIDVTPCATTILDLSKTEDQLLTSMHQKTRYNINLAQKKNLIIKQEKNFEVFFKLMNETAKRDGFTLHGRSHYEKVLNSDLIKQINVYVGGQSISAGVFIGFGDTLTYLYGASNYTERALMAPYLMQWEGIKLGKSLGYKFYDFYGIAPGKKNEQGEYIYNNKHQYAGITRFKICFGGQYLELPGTFDLIINPNKYWLYKILRVVRRIF